MEIESKLEKMEQKNQESAKTKAYKRLKLLFDEGTFVELDTFVKSSGQYAEVLSGFGSVDGCPVYAFSQNIDKEGGVVTSAHLKKIQKVYELAAKTGSPVVGIYDSVGAKLTEGNEMLAAYGDLLRACNNLSGVVPQISIVLGPCLGTSAMLAVSADFLIMEQNAKLSIATDGEHASSDEAEREGVSHITAKDEKDAVECVKNLITMLPSNNLSEAPIFGCDDSAHSITLRELSKTLFDSEKKDAARFIIDSLCDKGSFVELQEKFGQAMIVGFGRLFGNTVGMIVSNHDINNGVVDADACVKAARIVRFCDAFSIPVVTLVNSSGFASLKEASKLSNAYSEATTAKVTVIIGEAYGPLYIAVAGKGANADITFAWPGAVISPLAPETAAQILLVDKMKKAKDPIADRQKIVEDYKNTQASALSAAEEGFVEDVIDPDDTKVKLFAVLSMLQGKRVSNLPKKHSNF